MTVPSEKIQMKKSSNQVVQEVTEKPKKTKKVKKKDKVK